MANSISDLMNALCKEVPVNIYGQTITFKIMVPDPAEFFRDMNIGNPILEALQDAMKIVTNHVEKDGKITFQAGGLLGELSPLIAKAISDKETYNSLLENVNAVLHKAIIEPKLGTPGGDDLTIENIPINAKMAMINAMYGGGGLLNSLSIFRDGSPATVLTRRKSEAVRNPAEPTASNQ